ncbi:hypothetical protein [Burkholderia sp. IDO3]|nr:hypothetical protein [Burkholderia sp. IDO3]
MSLNTRHAPGGTKMCAIAPTRQKQTGECRPAPLVVHEGRPATKISE